MINSAKKRFAMPHLYQPVSGDLALWMKGNNPSNTSTKILDLSKKGNHGTISGATWKNTPLNHPCLSFDGADDYVEIANSASLQIAGPITIEAWVKPISGIGTYPEIVNKPYAAGWAPPYAAYAFRLNTLRPAFYTSFGVVNSNTDLSIDTWQHVVVSWDGTTARFYLNGVADGAPAFSGTIDQVNNQNVLIGGYVSSGGWWKGLIGEVRIYNRALSVSEVSKLYENTKYLYGK